MNVIDFVAENRFGADEELSERAIKETVEFLDKNPKTK